MKSKRTNGSSRKCCAPRRRRGCGRQVYATVLAHYAVRAVMLQAAAEAGLDPDRLSFTEAVFQISQAIDDGLVFAPEHRERLAQRLRRCLRPRIAQRDVTSSERA